jgi:hypothetical protein
MSAFSVMNECATGWPGKYDDDGFFYDNPLSFLCALFLNATSNGWLIYLRAAINI